MLVLTRRVEQDIVFPNIGVKLRILRVQGNRVRVGVDAPRSVKILREEIAGDSSPSEETIARQLQELAGDHGVVNGLTESLEVLDRQLKQGSFDEAGQTLEMVLRGLHAIDRQADTRPKKMKVDRELAALIVEDDHNQRELLAGFLRVSGFNVATAGDGAQALDYLEANRRPDFVLLDMLMPGVNGPDTVSAIRRRTEFDNLKIFAVSGNSPAELGVRTGPGGIDRWFPKPLDPEVLIEEVTRELV